MAEYQIQTSVTITDEFLDNILCDAFEGGITYWCGSVEVLPLDGVNYSGYASNAITAGHTLVLTDMEDDDEQWQLDKAKLLQGIQKFVTWCVSRKRPFSVDNYDGEDADGIVQFALFGEWVYG